jgi:hypothetical protein
MDWENERYVRIYTRDTADWLALSFDAQSLFMHLCRKVDRLGFLDLGRHGKRAVAVCLGQVALWKDRLEPALEELLTDGCIVVEGARLLIRNFVEAQESTKSGAQRQRDFKELRKAKLNHPAEGGNDSLPEGNENKRTVTGGNSVPSVPSVPPTPPEPPKAPPAPAVTTPASPVLRVAKETNPGDARELFAYWQRVMDAPRAALDKKREAACLTALGRYGLADCKRAVDGCFASDFHMNRPGSGNTRGKRFNDLALIFRDAEKAEGFIESVRATETRRAAEAAERARSVAEYEAAQAKTWTQPARAAARVATLLNLDVKGTP